MRVVEILADRPSTGADLEGGGGSGPPGIFKIYISENNVTLSALSWGIFTCIFQKISGSLRLPIIISIKCLSPVVTPGFKPRIRPPYPQRVVKGD